MGEDAREAKDTNGRDDGRRELAEEQARLIRSLGGSRPAPDGFDAERVRIAAASLRHKRMRTVAKVFPALPLALGDGFAGEFFRYADGHPLPAEGAKADGLGFARHLARIGLLPWRLRWRLFLRRWGRG